MNFVNVFRYVVLMAALAFINISARASAASIFDGLNYSEVLGLRIANIPTVPKCDPGIQTELEIMAKKGEQLSLSSESEILEAIDIARGVFFGVDPEYDFLKLYEPYESNYTRQGVINLVSLACGLPKSALRLQALYEYFGDCNSKEAYMCYVKSLFWGIISRAVGFDYPTVTDCMGRVLSKMED